MLSVPHLTASSGAVRWARGRGAYGQRSGARTRRTVSEGNSPNCLRYRAANRPNSQIPFRERTSVTSRDGLVAAWIDGRVN